MTHTIIKDKYPIYTTNIAKSETNYTNTSDIIKYLKTKIENHDTAKYIADFQHFEHTTSINGEIAEGIKDCQLVIFCFGKKIPDGQMTAARPRSISVTEYDDKFEISFLEAPAETANDTMQEWVKELLK